tara:strand:+ start:1614 stop:1982 length:369 start_codon:yes stop_codon:yes gene_type:complete
MIDTDKYEGHTEGKWNVLVSSGEDITQAHLHDETAGYYFFSQGYNREQEENYNHNESRTNARLMSDAPLLLAEVKRLYREPRMTIDEWNTKPEGPCVTVYMNGCEYVGCLRLYKNEDGEVIE